MGHRILKSDSIPSDFAISDCIIQQLIISRPKQAHPFFRSKSKNLKLGIGSHKKSEPDEDRGGSDQMDFFYSQLNLKGLP